MGIYCSCNVIPDAAFAKAIADKEPEIHSSPTLLDAVGTVYREARKGSLAQGELIIPSCTGCFNHVGKDIQKATGLFDGETLPSRTFDPATCQRQKQCFGSTPANSNVMDNSEGAPCVPQRAVAPV